MYRLFLKLILSILIIVSGTAVADVFKLSSTDIVHGKSMSSTQEFQGFGCNGANLSPQLSWTGVPKGTEAFAVFAYDPDAPTGSGWWHWQLVNIPKNITALVTGAGDPDKNLIPTGARNLKSDYGTIGFGGACPPKGHGAHRYQFTVYALSTKLELPEDASGALVGYMVHANAIDSSTIEVLYEKD